jgi:hypothetical protein
MQQTSSGEGIVMKTPNARFLGFAAMSVAACIASMPAKASLVVEGITYTLTETSTVTSVSGTTDNFTLDITGINTASDTIGGRYGVLAFAFNQPTGFLSATAPTGFTYHIGGLSTAGACNGTGNFFCFSNNTPPTTLSPTSSLEYMFTVTMSGADSFTGSGFKIDWAGTNNNNGGSGYSHVSDTLTPTAVPLPAAAWLLLSGIAGMGAMARRRRLTTAA